MTPFWFSFGHIHVSFCKYLAGVSYTIGKNIFKFVFENFSFERADAYQSLPGTCFTAMAINRSHMFACMLHDDFDIIVIYMKSTENEELVTP